MNNNVSMAQKYSGFTKIDRQLNHCFKAVCNKNNKYNRSLFLSQIAETYAFLPREAVTRFLMGCGECQKRMHISPSGAECKGK